MTRTITRPRAEPAAIFVTASALVLWDLNPRRNEDAIEPIMLCLLELGWGRPIVAQQATSRIIAGNTTYKASQRLIALSRESIVAQKEDLRRIAKLDLATEDGLTRLAKLLDALAATDWTRVPVRFRDLSDEDAYRLALADNKLGEIADWDEEKLAQVFAKIRDKGASLEVTGYSPAEIADIIERSRPPEPASEPDPEGGIPDPPSEPVTMPGMLWQLGPHRLFCGDALDARARQILIGDDQINLIHTDPPYGMKVAVDLNAKVRQSPSAALVLTKQANQYRPVIGDDRDYDPRLLMEAFGHVKEQFWWGADYYSERLLGKNGGSWIVWDKRAGIEDLEWSTSDFELCWSRQAHHRRIARVRWLGIHGLGEEDTKRRIHPTQKPVALVEWILGHWGRDAQVVADWYAGSGSTLIACQKLGKTALLMEIDPAYCDVIVGRWEAYTGQTARRI